MPFAYCKILTLLILCRGIIIFKEEINMKRSKRLLSLLLAVLVILTSVATATVVSTSAAGTLSSYYKTNPNGQVGANKTISIDGSLSDWDSSMLIAQGTANDDPRVYRPNSMYELGVDLYALYGAYDDNNIYLMWEMTNVQDVVAPNDNYPLSQGVLWQTQEFPFFIMVDTGKSDTAIGNNAALTTGGTIWNSGMTVQQSFNKLIAINTKGFNGPWVYGGNSSGLNPVEILNASTSKVDMGYGLGILSENVYGIDKAYGTYNGRVPGDVCDESAAWVDFNTLGHKSSTMDFFYEMSIPYSELGITKADVEANGVGVMVVATMGMSAMDCLPGDVCMTDQADLDDAANSQENNSFEKSDEDFITSPFARIGKLSDGTITPTPTPTQAPATEATEPTPAPTPAPTTAEPTKAPTTASTPVDIADPSDPVIIPPATTEPTEAPTTETTPIIPVPTLDTGDDNTTAPISEAPTTVKPTDAVPANGNLLGDTDLNGKVNIKDATLIQKHLAKVITLEEDAQIVSDVDGNDVLNIRDVTFIQKWLAKMDVEYKIGEPMTSGGVVIPVPTTEATEVTTNAPIIIPATTEATEPTEAPSTADNTEAPATVPTEEPTPAPTEEPTPAPTEAPVYTEPVYTEPVYTEPSNGTVTIYFENTYGWSSVYWHAWNDAGATNTPWPGDMMTNVSGNIYSATVSTEFTGIIFNDGSGSDSAKTEDTYIAGDGQMFSNGSWTTYDPNGNYGGGDDPYYPSGGGNTVYFSNNRGWSTVYAYCWSGDSNNGQWPGVQMTYATTNEFGEDIYSYDVPDGMTNIIFTDGSSQTVDIDLTTVSQNGFYLVDGSDGKFGYGTYDFVG